MSTFLSPATGNLEGKKEENSPGGDERVKSDPKCTWSSQMHLFYCPGSCPSEVFPHKKLLELNFPRSHEILQLRI